MGIWCVFSYLVEGVGPKLTWPTRMWPRNRINWRLTSTRPLWFTILRWVSASCLSTTHASVKSTHTSKWQVTTSIVFFWSTLAYQFEEAAKFRQWLTAIKEHRGYDQYQSAINSSGRVNANPTACSATSNLNGDGTISSNTLVASSDTPDAGQVPTRSNNTGLRNAPPSVTLRATKSINRMSNEHIAGGLGLKTPFTLLWRRLYRL